MPKFIHADNLALYTQDANECSEPWLRWQYWSGYANQWVDADGPLTFNPKVEYRRKPRTININGYEVPEPVREPLENGEKYWLASTEGVCLSTWNSSSLDEEWFAAGLVHLTEEAARQHTDALLSFTRRDK